MHFQVAVLSKQGGRTRNEDACGYWTSDSASCWVVSDGAGGHGGGDVASKLVVGSILRAFSAAPVTGSEGVAALLTLANRAVLDEQRTREDLGDMRATVVVLVIDNTAGRATWGHIGDTRLYCYRGARILFQTRDHSVLQTLLSAGHGDPALLRTHPQRGVLLCALGSFEDFQPSYAENPLEVLPGDVFLLCTDGLWEYVEEPAMESMLAAAANPQEWLAAMESEVLDRARHGHDNYTAIAVRVCAGSDA